MNVFNPLLIVASKICEKIVLRQFTSFLSSRNRLTSHQNGNRKFHSTETLNIMVSDHILEAMDQRSATALILLDLSKAFDSVHHPTLLSKLYQLGASPEVVKWFKSYLTGRTQFVRIGTAVSSSLDITSGVPQGAILSPLLFSIYVNELPQVPRHSCLKSYVDDSKMFLSFCINDANNAKEHLQQDLSNVAKCCSELHLLINPMKTKYLLIGTRQLLQNLPSDMSLIFLGEIITPVPVAKDLGLIMDSHLTYDQHITEVVSSCMSKLSQINRACKCFNKETLSLLISALVMNKLLYCSSVWSNTSAKNINKLQSVQNFACRIVTNTKKFDHITPKLRELSWLPVKEQLLFRDTVMMYKCVHDLAPPYLCNKFSKRSDLHERYTRNRELFQIPMYNTTIGQRTFNYRGAKIWNSVSTVSCLYNLILCRIALCI